jgi:hypothetical protein
MPVNVALGEDVYERGALPHWQRADVAGLHAPGCLLAARLGIDDFDELSPELADLHRLPPPPRSGSEDRGRLASTGWRAPRSLARCAHAIGTEVGRATDRAPWPLLRLRGLADGWEGHVLRGGAGDAAAHRSPYATARRRRRVSSDNTPALDVLASSPHGMDRSLVPMCSWDTAARQVSAYGPCVVAACGVGEERQGLHLARSKR